MIGLLLILGVLLQGAQAAEQAARFTAHLLEPFEGVPQLLLLFSRHRCAIGADDELGYLGRWRSAATACAGHHTIRTRHIRRGVGLGRVRVRVGTHQATDGCVLG